MLISNYQLGHGTWIWEEICTINSWEFCCHTVSIQLSLFYVYLCFLSGLWLIFCKIKKKKRWPSSFPQATEWTTPPQG